MKGKISTMCRSGIAMLLALCMVVGMASASVRVVTAAGHAETKYVSLGDSITNGYGLDGYDYEGANVWGFLQEVQNAYPQKVADHYGWDLTQLAMSGFRAEEVFYLLTYGSSKAYPGDDYTHKAGMERFEDEDIQALWPEYAGAANMAKLFQAQIKNADVVSIQLGSGNFGAFLTERLCWHLDQMADISFDGEYFETDIEKQLAIVSPEAAEFGMEMYNDLMAILKEQLASSEFADANLSALCESLTEAAVYSAIGFAYSYKGIIEWIDANSQAEVILVAMPNSLEGMVVTLPDGDSGKTVTLDFGKYFGYLVDAANTYMAGISALYDAEYQLSSNSSRDLKVYYAEPDSVELLGAQMATGNFSGCSVLEDRFVGDVVATMFPLLKDTVDDVVSEYGLELVDVTIPKLTAYKEFAAKWDAYVADSENIAEPTTTLSNNEILSCAIYLGIEAAIMKAAGMSTLDADALFALTGGEMNDVFAGIESALNPDDILDVDAVTDVVADAVMEDIMNDVDEIKEWILENYESEIADDVQDWVNTNKEQELADALLEWAEDNRGEEIAEEFLQWVADNYADEIEDRITNDGLSEEDAIEAVADEVRETDAGEDKLASIIEDLFADESDTEAQDFAEQTYMDLANDYITGELTDEYLNKSEVQDYIMDTYASDYMDVHMPWYASRYVAAGVTPVLANALKNNDTIMGLFHLFARYLMADAIGCHPSAKGHADIAKAIIAAYDGNCTAGDVTIGALIELMNKCYEDAYDYAKQEGYVDKAVDAVDSVIADLKAIDLSKTKLTAEGQAQVTAQINNIIDTLEATKTLLTDADALDRDALNALRNLRDEAVEAVEELIAFTTLEADDSLQEVLAKVKAKLIVLFGDPTHGEYTITPDSHYVALGDNTAVSDSYVDLLATEMSNLCKANYSYTNLAQEGLLIQDVYAILNQNEAEIKKADLITLGFGSNGFTNFAVEQVMNQINEEPINIDWTVFVGEEGLPYIEAARTELYNYLVDCGVSGEYEDVNLTDLLTVAIESYVYSYLNYAYNLPKVLEAVNTMNPDALVIIVGMYNPLENVVVDLEDTELAVGEYLQYVVDATNTEALLVAMFGENAVYVDAPAVEVNNTKTEMTTLQFISEFVYYKAVGLNPNQNGHAYIKDQILNALTIQSQVDALLGDADNNGTVDNFDAMLILQYSVELATAQDLNLSVCNVNGDDFVDNLDAMLVLQYSVGIITVFPVAE